MKRLKLTTSWWRPGKDLDTFGLVKFFSLPGFVVILVFTGILTVLLTLRAQQMTLKKNEDYLILLASNLNHQIYQQFVLPTAFEKGGRITLSDPEQSQRLDMVVRTTIHGFHVEQLNQYDQEGVFSYSTTNQPLGKKCDDVLGVRKALEGENYFELPGYSNFWSILWPRSYKNQNLRAYIPFRLEEKLLPQTGPVVGVIEITQNISGDLAEIGNFRLIILITLVVIMGLLFIVLRQIVKQAGIILERRQEEQRRLEGQLHQSERLAALGEMTAGVAHEIRNPLGIISSTAELLQRRLARYEPKDRLARIIVEEANRLNEKVTEFLDFARPRIPNLRPCDLEAALNRSLEFLQPEIERLGITVTREFHLNGRALVVDPDLLHQAFLNILLNAIQAMPQGGQLTVSTLPGPRGQGVELHFHDDGEGIDPEALKKVLNPFFTTKEKGSGLGLPIVKSIIEAHQGHLKIDSLGGMGTTVVITIPELALKKAI
ncbi:MAG: ATP-binding protein [Syntrophobacterales bacterium]|jgi:signal transduction histidine kinase|nr:ATP-binding protein [Syntrophobacterales bacterium]